MIQVRRAHDMTRESRIRCRRTRGTCQTTSYAGGNGQLGIHGTSEPWSIGRDVSHGCIRVHNGVVRRLARIIPLGTPVVIR